MSYGTKMFDRAMWHQQSMLPVISSCEARSMSAWTRGRSSGWVRCSTRSKVDLIAGSHSKILKISSDQMIFATGDFPAKAARAAYSLCFGEIHLALPQSNFGSLVPRDESVDEK